MARPLLLLLVLALAGCQGDGAHDSAGDAGPGTGTFDRETVQRYDIQTGQFQQGPPFGARSNQSQ